MIEKDHKSRVTADQKLRDDMETCIYKQPAMIKITQFLRIL